MVIFFIQILLGLLMVVCIRFAGLGVMAERQAGAYSGEEPSKRKWLFGLPQTRGLLFVFKYH